MLLKLLILRLRQFGRIIREAGLILLIAALVSVFPFLTTSFGILYKYARLNPVFHRPPSANIPSLFLFLLLIPGGILMHIGYLVILFRKANKNLRYYYA